jgi:hypothetical protein
MHTHALSFTLFLSPSPIKTIKTVIQLSVLRVFYGSLIENG